MATGGLLRAGYQRVAPAPVQQTTRTATPSGARSGSPPSYALVGRSCVALVGHTQAQYMVRTQPMKMAAAEALWESEDPASLSLFTWGNEPERRDVWAVEGARPAELPRVQPVRRRSEGHRRTSRRSTEQRYGPGDYVAPDQVDLLDVPGDGRRRGADAAAGRLGGARRGRDTRIDASPRLLALLVPAIALPYVAHSTGWIFTEIGRAAVDRVRPPDDRGRRVAGRHRRRTVALAGRLHAALRRPSWPPTSTCSRSTPKAGVTGKDLAAADHAAAEPARA